MTTKLGIWGILLLSVLMFGTGCNTLEGVGEDVQDAGEEVQDAAD
ncbi:MAG: hypothetical protein NPIRA04_08810 [Nitrospirales bacterium]|nr:MAG: hypothetical protein NPIRA04_08810 [Nitrospirales bacterium]